MRRRTRKTCGPISRSLGCSKAVGAHVPHVHEMDIARGLLLLEDLGITQYLSRLECGDDPDRLYGDALDALADIQVRGQEAAGELPPYDREPLLRELSLDAGMVSARRISRSSLSPEDREIIRACV